MTCDNPELGPSTPIPDKPESYLVDRLIQHGPGVQKALDKIQEADDMDTSLRGDGTHPLSRRFLVNFSSEEAYPFKHKRLILQPKRADVRLLNIEGIVLRPAVTKDDEQRATAPIVVTYGHPGGIVTNFLLSDTCWEPFTNSEELMIDSDGNLIGVKESAGRSPFDHQEFAFLLDSMEPELQTNEAT